MLAVISPLVERGVIDNTVRDLIDICLWCVDGLAPLHYRMQGNCLRDIAGCRVEFVNKLVVKPLPDAAELPLMHRLREPGTAVLTGDITLSRRVVETNNRRAVTNQLSLEWFVGTEMRLLVESSDYTFTLSLPSWEMSGEEENVQRLINREHLRAHVQTSVRRYRGPSLAQLGEDLPPCDWDYLLNKAEAYMAIYPTLREKYAADPDGHLSEAYVMDRLDFLGKEAEADEAHMPPESDAGEHTWEVMDFIDKPWGESVHRAMHHPLFLETSRVSAVVQEKLLGNGTASGSAEEEFVRSYAGIVSHILSTILLTQQADCPAALACTRVKVLCQRLRMLPSLCRRMPVSRRVPLMEATQSLLNHLEEFITTIPH